MVHIELDYEGTEMLKEILGSHLSELRMEVAHTDRKEFREFLEKRKKFLEHLLQELDRESVIAGKRTIGAERIPEIAPSRN